MDIYDGLAQGWREGAPIQRHHERRWRWWQQAGHARLVEEIGLVVDGAPCHAGLIRALGGRDAEQEDRSDNLIRELGRVVEQQPNLLPVMRWLAALVSALRHGASQPAKEAAQR